MSTLTEGLDVVVARERVYLERLVVARQRLAFQSLSPTDAVPSLPLHDIFLDLDLLEEAGERAEQTSETAPESRAHHRRKLGEICQELSYLEHRSCVLLGDPGSGKTTILRYLSLGAAQPKVYPLTPALPRPAEGSTLPIYLPLASAGKQLSGGLQRLLARYNEESLGLSGLADVFAQALAEGRALLLLDGLDEVGDPAARQAVAQEINRLISQWAPQGNRCLVTSRIAGYRQAPIMGAIPHYVLQPLSDKNIKQFIERWFATGSEWSTAAPNGAQQELQELLELIHSTQFPEPLTRSPLLLSILILMFRQTGKLPRRRIEIYDFYTHVLLGRSADVRSGLLPGRTRSATSLDPHLATHLLTELALALHSSSNTGLGRVEAALLLTGLWLRQRGYDLATAPEGIRSEAARVVREFLESMEHQASLLVDRGGGFLAFTHLTLQEYFVGRGLARMEPESRWDLIRSHIHDSQWREPLMLCAGHLGVIEYRADAASSLVRHILSAGSAYEEILHRDLLLTISFVAEDVGLPASLLDEIYVQILNQAPTAAPTLRTQLYLGLWFFCQLGYEKALVAIEKLLRNILMLERLNEFSYPLLNGFFIHGGKNVPFVLKELLTQIGEKHFRQAAPLPAHFFAPQTSISEMTWTPELKAKILSELNSSEYQLQSEMFNLLSYFAAVALPDEQVLQCLSDYILDSKYINHSAVPVLALAARQNANIRQMLLKRLSIEDELTLAKASNAGQAWPLLGASFARKNIVDALAACALEFDEIRNALTHRLLSNEESARAEMIRALAPLLNNDSEILKLILRELPDDDDAESTESSLAALEALAGLNYRDLAITDHVARLLSSHKNESVQDAAYKVLSRLITQPEPVIQYQTAFLSTVDLQSFKAALRPGPIALFPITVLIGRNAAGKSTLLEALQWIDTALRHGADAACARYRGLHDLINQRADSPPSFRIALQWEYPAEDGRSGQLHFAVRVREAAGTGAPIIIEEEVYLDVDGERTWLINSRAGEPGRRVVYPEDPEHRFEFEEPDRLALGLVGRRRISSKQDPFVFLNGFFERAVFLRLNPQTLARGGPPYRSSFEPLLDEEGNALPALLKELSTEGRARLVRCISRVLPQVAGIDLLRDGEGREESLSFSLHEQLAYGGNSHALELPAWMLSEGTRRLTALFALLVREPPPLLLCIEEIENGLDPWTVVQVLRELESCAEQSTQVVLTTHSPWLLDHMQLQSVLQVRRVEGDVRYERFADRDAVRAYSDSVPPGTIFVQEQE